MSNQDNYTYKDGVLTFADNIKHIKAVMVPAHIAREMERVVIPKRVKTIGHHAFYYCNNLKSVEIPNSVKTIESYAFADCSSLQEIRLGKGLAAIGEEAFSGCENLKAYIDDIADWCKIRFYSFRSNPIYSTCELYLNEKLVNHLKIPEGVSYINRNAFIGNSNIKTVSLPKTLKSISAGAFLRVKPESVHIADLSAWCKIRFEEQDSNPAYLSSNLVLNGNSITSLVIPSDINEINNFAFTGTNIERVKINKNVKAIKLAAFYSCGKLNYVALPDSIEKIDQTAFRYCSEGLMFKCNKTPYLDEWLKLNHFRSTDNTSKIDIFLSSVTDDLEAKSV